MREAINALDTTDAARHNNKGVHYGHQASTVQHHQPSFHRHQRGRQGRRTNQPSHCERRFIRGPASHPQRGAEVRTD